MKYNNENICTRNEKNKMENNKEKENRLNIIHKLMCSNVSDNKNNNDQEKSEIINYYFNLIEYPILNHLKILVSIQKRIYYLKF